MRRVSIRDLSGDVIRNCANQNEVLGVSSKGTLVGVLVPLTQEILQRLATNDADEIATRAAETDADTGVLPTNLRDVLEDPAPSAGRSNDFSRVSIREITGARLEQASSTGKPLVVTSDRVAVAVFLPLISGWVDRLVEQSVSRFLTGRPVLGPDPVAHRDLDTPSRAELFRTSGRRFASQRAIGIRIVGDARGDRERIVGVVTDGLARIKVDAITLPLEQLDETYVFEQILSLIDMLVSHMNDADELMGVGIEIGGHVSDGRVVHSTNIRWDQFPLAAQLSEIVGVPVVLENDANALAIHERYSQGISADNFAVVLLTHLGVGSGLILGGRLHRGHRGMAAELGHIPIASTESLEPKASIDAAASVVHRCRCGNPDCLEAVATPHAIEVALQAKGFMGSYESAITKTDDALVRDAFTHAGAALGKGIATVLNLLNPEAVVIYGPLDVVGPPRQFHIDNFETVADAKALTGAGRIYTGAMMQNIRSHVFSNATEECQFIVRIRSDEQGAKAAAACVIRAIRDNTAIGRSTRVPMDAERSR